METFLNGNNFLPHCSHIRETNHNLGHSGKSVTIQEVNHGSGICKEHYAKYYELKSSILLARTGVWKISSVAWGFSSIKIEFSDYPKSLISRINEVYVFFKSISP